MAVDQNFLSVKKYFLLIIFFLLFASKSYSNNYKFTKIVKLNEPWGSSFINNNEIILKKLGRINNILNDDLDKPAATMVVSGDLFKIYFDKDVDLKLIKENLTSKQNRIQDEMNKISQRLENKSFVDRAPKEIVEQEKTNYNNLKNDIDKILVTIKGI